MPSPKYVRIVQPELDYTEPNVVGIEDGGKYNTFTEVVCTNYGDTFQSYQIIPPSLNTVIDRTIIWENSITLKFTGTPRSGGTGRLLSAGYDAPRSFGMHKLTDNVDVMINGESHNFRVGSMISALQTLNGDSVQEWAATCPTMPDNCQSYNSFLGTVHNVLATIADSPSRLPITRGAFDVSITSAVDDTSATVTWTERCPIMCSPLTWTTQKKGLTGIRQLNVNFTLNTGLWRLWSHAPGGTPSTINGVAGNNTSGPCSFLQSPPKLYIRYLTPKVGNGAIPRHLSIGYYQTEAIFTPSTSTVNSGQNITFNFTPQPRPNIPTRMLIFARVPLTDLLQTGCSFPDCFLALQSLNITFNNVTGIMQNETPFSLWLMSKKNGSCQSWQDFAGVARIRSATGADATLNSIGTQGSVGVFDFGTDIPLDDGLCQGMKGPMQISITATFKNTNTANLTNTEMGVIFIDEGNMEITPGECNTVMNSISPAQLREAQNRRNLAKSVVSLYGGARAGWTERHRTDIGRFVPPDSSSLSGGAVLSREDLTGRLY